MNNESTFIQTKQLAKNPATWIYKIIPSKDSNIWNLYENQIATEHRISVALAKTYFRYSKTWDTSKSISDCINLWLAFFSCHAFLHESEQTKTHWSWLTYGSCVLAITQKNQKNLKVVTGTSLVALVLGYQLFSSEPYSIAWFFRGFQLDILCANSSTPIISYCFVVKSFLLKFCCANSATTNAQDHLFWKLWSVSKCSTIENSFCSFPCCFKSLDYFEAPPWVF